MHASVALLKRTLELNTRLFARCLDGMSDAQALERTSGATNHAAFLAVHLVDTRHFLARALGLESPSPFRDLLEEARGIDDIGTFPGLESIRTAWASVSRALSERLESLGEEELAQRAAHSFPIEGGDTLLGCVTFLVQHDSFHIGQLALVRKHVGLEAMSYR